MCVFPRSSEPVPVQKIVRSKRLLERQTKRRRVPKPQVEDQEMNYRRKPEPRRKFDEGFDPNDPLRLFLWGPETTQLLTAKEEAALIMKIQVCCSLHCLFCRRYGFEPGCN